MGASLLYGDPVVKDIERWCLRKGRRGAIEPVLAVLFFNTDAAAEDYVRIKAHVAAKAGVGYWVYEMSPEATSAQVQAQVRELNQNSHIHGILIQRPLPEHLNEPKIMGTIDTAKHIEQYCEGKSSDIAADALSRLLAKYGRRRDLYQSTIHIVGFGNIITDNFVSHMKRQYPWVSVSPNLPGKTETKGVDREGMLVSELHRGPGYIKTDMIPRGTRTIIDFGFYSTEKDGIVGDVDHTVFEEGGLAIAPTPGGVLPILLWLMMERTIRARRLVTKKGSYGCCVCQ